MSVADRDRRVFDPGYLSLDQLAVTLVVLRINGNDVFVDPGEKLLPLANCAGLICSVADFYRLLMV